jgi:DNA-binding NtrC family response regulator
MGHQLLAICRKNLYQSPSVKKHILVVDDEAPIRELLESYFKRQGYQVSVAASGNEAVTLANENPLDVIILDIVLPDTDGLELLGNLKTTHPNLPVIIMTGIGFDEELLQEARLKGAAGYVSKTLPLEQLLMEVHRILKQKSSK